MEFEKVIHGIIRYIEKVIYPTLNQTQLFFAYTVVNRYKKNIVSLRDEIEGNALLKPLAVMDENGEVDVDGWISDIKGTMDHFGKLTINIPLVGPYTFRKEDIDHLYETIKESRYEDN